MGPLEIEEFLLQYRAWGGARDLLFSDKPQGDLQVSQIGLSLRPWPESRATVDHLSSFEILPTFTPHSGLVSDGAIEEGEATEGISTEFFAMCLV